MKVAIVDANTEEITQLKGSLEPSGYAVMALTQEATAVEHIVGEQQAIDLILLDWTVSGINGLAVCNSIRNQGIMIPILMISDKSRIEDKEAAFTAGVDDYLTKPFDIRELQIRMQALLRRPRETISQKLIIGDVEMLLERRKVYKHGEEIALTLTEYELLQFLAQHPNRILTREQLIGAVWGEHFNPYSNALDVHMKNVRKKLGLSEDNHLIETIRGVGFRLNM